MSGVVNAIGGVFDGFTGDAFDLDRSKKKQAKKIKKSIEESTNASIKEQEELKKKNKQSKKSFYESMRDGNLSMLDSSLEQKIG